MSAKMKSYRKQSVMCEYIQSKNYVSLLIAMTDKYVDAECHNIV